VVERDSSVFAKESPIETEAELIADCRIPIEIVGRFLALLELYRTRAVAFEQPEPLGVLQVSWTGGSPTEQQLHEPEDES